MNGMSREDALGRMTVEAIQIDEAPPRKDEEGKPLDNKTTSRKPFLKGALVGALGLSIANYVADVASSDGSDYRAGSALEFHDTFGNRKLLEKVDDRSGKECEDHAEKRAYLSMHPFDAILAGVRYGLFKVYGEGRYFYGLDDIISARNDRFELNFNKSLNSCLEREIASPSGLIKPEKL